MFFKAARLARLVGLANKKYQKDTQTLQQMILFEDLFCSCQVFSVTGFKHYAVFVLCTL